MKEADADDYKKLARVMQYLRATKYLPLILGTDDSGNIYWYQDGAHAVHRDMRGHTGLMMTFGTGAVYARSTKQKLNTRRFRPEMQKVKTVKKGFIVFKAH